MNSPLDPCDHTILGDGYKNVAILEGQGLIMIKEDSESKFYETNEPKFELVINAPASVGERIRMIVTNHPHVINIVPEPPKKGWMRWSIMLKFKVAGDDDTPEGKELRKESIRKVWEQLVRLLTKAITGIEEEVRPNVRPVTNITNLVN